MAASTFRRFFEFKKGAQIFLSADYRVVAWYFAQSVDGHHRGDGSGQRYPPVADSARPNTELEDATILMGSPTALRIRRLQQRYAKFIVTRRSLSYSFDSHRAAAHCLDIFDRPGADFLLVGPSIGTLVFQLILGQQTLAPAGTVLGWVAIMLTPTCCSFHASDESPCH